MYSTVVSPRDLCVLSYKECTRKLHQSSNLVILTFTPKETCKYVAFYKSGGFIIPEIDNMVLLSLCVLCVFFNPSGLATISCILDAVANPVRCCTWPQRGAKVNGSHDHGESLL